MNTTLGEMWEALWDYGKQRFCRLPNMAFWDKFADSGMRPESHSPGELFAFRERMASMQSAMGDRVGLKRVAAGVSLALLCVAGFAASVVADGAPARPSAISFPPAVTTTNEQGGRVTQFAMRPVVTNLTVASNELAGIEKRSLAIDDELKALVEREKQTRSALVGNNQAMTGYATNYVPADAEGKKMRERVVELESELRALKDQLSVKMQADEDYRRAKAKADADRSEWQSLQESKDRLRREKAQLAGQSRQVRALMEQAEREAKAKGEGSTGNPP